MWKEILLLNGTISDANGNEIDDGKLFKLLEDNGYEYEGGYGKIKSKDMNEAVNRIDEFITDDVLQRMIDTLVGSYDEMNREDIDMFFGTNYGTGSFDEVFNSVLNEELKELYKKYTNTNWQVSDEFGGSLGEVIIKKMNTK